MSEIAQVATPPRDEQSGHLAEPHEDRAKHETPSLLQTVRGSCHHPFPTKLAQKSALSPWKEPFLSDRDPSTRLDPHAFAKTSLGAD